MCCILQVLSTASLLVLGCPTQRFTTRELEALRAYLLNGGALLVCMSEGGEAKAGTNINFLLEEFGVAANNDAVVRTVHYKYMHPKEALISDGVLNRAVLSGSSGSGKRGGAGNDSDVHDDGGYDVGSGNGAGNVRLADDANGGLDFVYPHGCTLSVQRPAVPILSSGKIAYPMHRPLAAAWAGEGGGRLLVLGSAAVFDDTWLDKEDNSRLMEFVFRWLRPVSWGLPSLWPCMNWNGRTGQPMLHMGNSWPAMMPCHVADKHDPCSCAMNVDHHGHRASSCMCHELIVSDLCHAVQNVFFV